MLLVLLPLACAACRGRRHCSTLPSATKERVGDLKPTGQRPLPWASPVAQCWECGERGSHLISTSVTVGEKYTYQAIFCHLVRGWEMEGLGTLKFVCSLFSSLSSFMELKFYFSLEPYFHCESDNRAVKFLKPVSLKSLSRITIVYSK